MSRFRPFIDGVIESGIEAVIGSDNASDWKVTHFESAERPLAYSFVATDKRERQRANRELRREQEAREEKVEHRKQRGFTFGMIGMAVIAGLALLFFATRGGDDTEEVEAVSVPDATEDAEATDEETTEEEAAEEPADLGPAISVPEPGGTIDGETACPEVDGSSERITTFSAAPPMCIDPSGLYTATFTTSSGPIVVDLDAAAAPETVNNFVVLARYHYYDDVPFHRIIPGFVIQGGDAVGPILGTGNPGYLIDEEPPAEPVDDSGNFYQVGSLAMAKSAGPTATGAQFFIVTGDQGAALPPEYSLFGTVTEGMETVTAIESIPTTPQDQPTEEIVIESVEIVESLP